MINEQEFGKRLTECMQINGYTNAKLTEKLNVSKNAVGNYKNGQIPNATILYNISQLLGTTVEYLLTGKNSDETNYKCLSKCNKCGARNNKENLGY